ncbi:sigma-70 family RNA polymerase sigma factor [Streptomyces sp. NPDC020362]|uniref:RNA polymerase sigma factor n=1 Tax=unclassified Streptomyces TaxID=2593676 RepID=UPI0033E2D9E6
MTALFDELYEPLRRFLSRYGKESGTDLSSDRDIVMGAFRAAIEQWEDFGTLSEKHQEAWLFAVCRNHRIDELRRQGRLGALMEQKWALERTWQENPEQVVLDRLAVAKCVMVLNDMPPARRAVATMAWLLQMATKEIATELDMSPGNVRVHLCHARSALREQVGPYLSFPVKDRDDGRERRRA